MNVPFFILVIVISLITGLIWVYGIDKMKKEYPDYKGEDFLELPNKEQFFKL